ncbi:MAG: ATP-dependent Clp protease ATP-binding subunit ClpC [Parcubacteria group bacterium Gr01-1014_13]|nr:MAG: ATP-dependent Clp protease ATP-binding subunit ClpC [Parcubacteria group bacterium Gr01-1014_13]
MSSIVDRFSTHLRAVLVGSIRIATELKNTSVEPIHLLLALSTQKGSVASEVLSRYHLDTKSIEKIAVKLKPGTGSGQNKNLSPFSLNSKTALEKALIVAQKNGHNYLGTEHLLSALVNLNDPQLEQLFKKNNLKKTELNDQLEVVLTTASQFPQITEIPEAINRLQETLSDDAMLHTILPNDKKTKKKEAALDFFAANLTSQEIQSGIDPVIGRENEIERMMQVLCRRTKNNPILLGDPGVGKTAIVEGLAKRIAAGEVPDVLLGKKIYALDMGLLIAGTAYRGEFEGRLRQVIEEVSSDPNIILFIDELHNIVGAGSNQGTMDAANILKPVLARGVIRCIGATTLTEFKKHIESDPALERRFQPIIIKEPSVEDTIKILMGIKDNYENFHNLKITNEAIVKTVQLSNRYITNKLLPDKAIDLLDETAAAKRLSVKPTLAESRLLRLKNELAKTTTAKEIAAGHDRFSEAVKLKEKEKIIEQEIKYYKEKISTQKIPKTASTVTEKDIINQLAKIIETPIRDLFINEKYDFPFESELQKHIIGQDEVLREVAQIIRQAKLELSNPNRPLASFLFVGESGVGKTGLAKSLAAALYPSQSSFIQLNMSEFNESFGVSKLLGSPAGYVGYKESNQFTDRIKMNPYCVILLDEIDKAHKDVTKLLLQMLENGEITDSVGKKISLKHAIIILTTSLGADELKKSNIGFGKAKENSENKKIVKDKLKDFFSAELINRLDQICLFNSLTKTDLAKIAALEITELNKQLVPYNTALGADDEVFAWFVDQLAEKNNAREVRRQIRNHVEKIMAELIVQNKIKAQHKLVLQENKLSVR